MLTIWGGQETNGRRAHDDAVVTPSKNRQLHEGAETTHDYFIIMQHKYFRIATTEPDLDKV